MVAMTKNITTPNRSTGSERHERHTRSSHGKTARGRGRGPGGGSGGGAVGCSADMAPPFARVAPAGRRRSGLNISPGRHGGRRWHAGRHDEGPATGRALRRSGGRERTRTSDPHRVKV